MREAITIDFAGQARRRRLFGATAALGVVVMGLAIAVLSSMSENNATARQTREATLVLRTNQWLTERGLDANSSVDMMKALILACDEMKTRGERC